MKPTMLFAVCSIRINLLYIQKYSLLLPKLKIMTIDNLVYELQRQEGIKRDFIVPARALSMHSNKEIMLAQGVNAQLNLKPTTTFHDGLSERLAIPRAYYKKMEEQATSLLAQNVNHWLESKEKQGSKFLVRTFKEEVGGEARALLSNRHHMIDNLPVLLETLNAIKEAGLEGDIVIKKCVLSERKMYVEFTCPAIQVEAVELLKYYRKAISAGTGIITGFLLENSEVGRGAFKLTPRAVVLCCQNGALDPRMALKKIHLGSSLTDGLDFSGIKEIREANITLIREQLKYAVKHFLTKEYLETLVKKYEALGLPEIAAPVNKVTEVIGEKFGWTESAAQNLLMRFVEGGDMRRIGMFNAMTFVAQEFEDDSKYDAEVAAWDVLSNFEVIEKLAIKKIMHN